MEFFNYLVGPFFWELFLIASAPTWFGTMFDEIGGDSLILNFVQIALSPNALSFELNAISVAILLSDGVNGVTVVAPVLIELKW